MQASRLLRNSSSSSSGPLPSLKALENTRSTLSRAASSLLPPIPLYRRLLRAHRKHLTYEMRSLGDTYIKDEFKRHKKIENPLQIVGFLGQWKIYLDQLEENESGEGQGSSSRGRYFEGKRLSTEDFERLNEEQMYQLHEFMTAAKDLYDPSAGAPPPPPQPQTDEQINRGAASEGDQVLKDILNAGGKKSS